jgi:hypothetical protein
MSRKSRGGYVYTEGRVACGGEGRSVCVCLAVRWHSD